MCNHSAEKLFCLFGSGLSGLGQYMRLGAGVKFVRVNFGPAAPELKKGDVAASAVAVDLGFLYDGFLSSARVSKQFFRHSLPWHKMARQSLTPGFSFGAALAKYTPFPSLSIINEWRVYTASIVLDKLF
ncbi:hypothetical protein L0337_24125 [candidate division KSB1 bacterium]|nr:hypothetical protein [candidate division KSB1 bacterium]